MNVISRIAGWLRPAAHLPADERMAVERAVDRVDPLLRLVSGYQGRLAPAVRQALAHCDALVAALPGPVDVHAQAFGSDPLVRVMFSTPGDIAETLGRSPEVRQFLAAPGHQLAESFHGLLGARRREKKVMGTTMFGDMVQADAPQTLLYFTDHTLRAIGANLDETRRQLRLAGLDSLADGYAAHRKEANDRSLQGAEEVLAELCEWLMAATDHLRLEPVSVAVDLLGVEASGPGPGVHQISFPELVGQDRRRWTLMLVRLSRDEALAAIQRQQQAARYLVI
ncbi:MAG: hypothetical protein KJ634_03185 [Gammaproteobacteria bacterium]|nr:hypothetical protein [Gammaproteobacteria bacterium]MBU1414606.1 hypothetical protein [Gammaproteobacteria bacterium]